MILRNGLWDIESYYSYRSLFEPFGTYFHLRQLTFDIAKVLGQNEAWYADEYHTYNNINWEIPSFSFESWIKTCVKSM